MGALATLLIGEGFEFHELFMAMMNTDASIFCLVPLARTCRTATAWCKMQLRQCNKNHIWDLLKRMPMTQYVDVRRRFHYPPHRKMGEIAHILYAVPELRPPILWSKIPNPDTPLTPFHLFVLTEIRDGSDPRFTVQTVLSRMTVDVGTALSIGEINTTSMCRFAMFEDDIHFVFREQFPPADPEGLVARLRKEIVAVKDLENILTTHFL